MIPYEKVIIEKLKGETPKEKYDNLMEMKKFIQKISFPRRGSEEENWTIYDIAKLGETFICQHETYE